jgi:hypothetical protein
MIFVYDRNHDRDLTASMLARNPQFKVSIGKAKVAATKIRLPKQHRRAYGSQAQATLLRELGKVLS